MSFDRLIRDLRNALSNAADPELGIAKAGFDVLNTPKQETQSLLKRGVGFVLRPMLVLDYLAWFDPICNRQVNTHGNPPFAEWPELPRPRSNVLEGGSQHWPPDDPHKCCELDQGTDRLDCISR